MRWIRRSTAAVLIFALAAFAPAGVASEASDASQALQHSFSQDPESVRDYWTPQRMREADPRELLELDAARPRIVPDGPSGPPTLKPGSEPAATRRGTRTLTSFRRAAQGPIPYTRGEILDPSVFPYRTNGRLFGIDGFGEPFSCSATAVSGQSRSVVITAGHCVYLVEAGGWSKALTFVPGYKDGSSPYGQWPILESWAPGGWVQFQSPSYDVMALVAAPNAEGLRLEDLVGGRGIAWNVSRKFQFDALGYPGVPPFTGERLVQCESAYGVEDPFFPEKPRPTAIGCDMTEGSSGGGWIIRDVYLNGVNSHGLEGLDEVMFGPYFGDAVATIYGQASNSTAPGPLSATPPPAPLVGQIHGMKLSLKLVGHLAVRGKLSAPDGYVPCAGGVQVGIVRRFRGKLVLAKVTRTDQRGNYDARIKEVEGTYIALALEDSVDDLNVCAEAKSRAVRHR